MHVVVIGGGAAGFFAAISAKRHHPDATVQILEKSDKLLSKVRVSGGGRCNVSHACIEPKKLAAHYPRGERFLRNSFKVFNVKDTIAWFEERGVSLKTEEDGRMFPITDDSNTIISCLMREAERSGIQVKKQCAVLRLDKENGKWLIQLQQGGAMIADRVIIATGGHPKPEAYQWLKELGHTVVQPVPSLFTFNLPDEPIRELMGVVVDPARVRIIGADLVNTGPLLITHWGFSGPAVLKLSALGARAVHALGYDFTIQVNWLGTVNETDARKTLSDPEVTSPKKKAINVDPFRLPNRAWRFFLNKAGIDPECVWEQVLKKERNRLIDLLTNDRYHVKGKTTFKEEFVTAGGVDLAEVDPMTMASSVAPGIYFAGEVLDIDGITGGFNFQAAWTTGYLAGRLLLH